jgi:outer membrane lipoprotein SlyB
LELTRIVIDGKDYPVVSSDYTLQGKGRGSNTAKKVGGGAVAGAIIGAIAGGGKGAAIGAGVGSAAGAGVQVLTRGQQVKVPSETVLEFRLQQPATVAPTQR